MTRAELLAELQTGPLRTELAPLLAAGRDADVASALNRRDQPGYVPSRLVGQVLLKSGGLTVFDYIWKFNLNPLVLPQVPPPLGVWQIASQVMWAVQLAARDYRLEVVPLTAAMAGAVAAGVATKADQTAILAGEVKLSRAEVAWGYGTGITAGDVAAAQGRI